MRDVINAATALSGGSSLTGAATGQLVVAVIGLIFLIGFGLFGAWLKWKDSKAIRRALESGDLQTALKLRAK